MREHEMWNEFGNLYLLSGSYDQAIHSYTRAISLDGNFGRSYSNMAQAYVRMGKHTEAIALYQRGIELLAEDDEKAFSWYQLGRVYHHLRDDHRAMEAYQRADELSPNVRASSEAVCLFDRQPATVGVPPKMEEAHIASNRVEDDPSSFPEELTPWWFENQTIPEEEILWYDSDMWVAEEAGIAIPDEEPIFIKPLNWGLASLYETNLVQAEMLQVGVNIDDVSTNSYSSNPPRRNEEAELAAGVHTSEALPEIPRPMMQEQRVEEDQCMQFEQGQDSIFVVSMDVEEVSISPQITAENAADLIEEVPAEPLIELIVEEPAPEELKEIQADIGKFKRVVEINPRNAYAWDTLGGLYKRMGQFNDAIEAYQHAVSLDPDKAFYFHHLGLVYAAEGRYDEAINLFERVTEINPNHSLAHATLGGYYRKKGMEELAQEHIEKARSLLGEDENEYNQACMEAICQNSDKALELLEIALKNKQTPVNWASKDPDLDFVRSDPRFQALLARYATRSTP